MNNPYLYIFCASILMGFHIFSIKYINLHSSSFISLIFYCMVAVSFFIWIITRFIMYYSSNKLPISIIHLIMNLSIIVTTLLAFIILKTQINWYFFFIGIVFLFFGFYLINFSVNNEITFKN